MKIIVLAFALSIITVNSMEDLYRTPVSDKIDNLDNDSIIPLTITTCYKTINEKVSLEKSFKTSRAIIVFDYSEGLMHIKYERYSFVVPMTHELFKEINGVISKSRLDKSQFSEKSHSKDAVFLIEYSKVPTLSYSVIYDAIKSYTSKYL